MNKDFFIMQAEKNLEILIKEFIEKYNPNNNLEIFNLDQIIK